MKLNISMLILLALLELIVWTSSNHVNLKSETSTVNSIKTLIKSSNKNSNKHKSNLMTGETYQTRQRNDDSTIHKESN
jgi:hypothetical protein